MVTHGLLIQGEVQYSTALFYLILTLIWLVSHANLLNACLFSQKTFQVTTTETWVRLGKDPKEYAVSVGDKNHRGVVFD